MTSLKERIHAVYPISIKDEGLVIYSELHIRSAAWSGPANPHVSSTQSLKLKVPLPRLHRVGLLHTEEAYRLDALIIKHVHNFRQRYENQRI